VELLDPCSAARTDTRVSTLAAIEYVIFIGVPIAHEDIGRAVRVISPGCWHQFSRPAIGRDAAAARNLLRYRHQCLINTVSPPVTADKDNGFYWAWSGLTA
jgi:hypothetical protein